MVEWVKIGDEDPNSNVALTANIASTSNPYGGLSVTTTPEATAEAAKVIAASTNMYPNQATAQSTPVSPVPGQTVEVKPVVKSSWVKDNILYLVGMAGLAVYIIYIVYGMLTKIEPVTVTVEPLSFSQILEVKPYYLRAQRRDGQIQVNSQGSAGWRYNNPGKIDQGEFAREHGSLGSDGKLALFPSYDVGRKAAEDLLFNAPALGFSNSTIENAIAHWALKSDKYNPSTYTNDVANAAGVPKSTSMSDLTPDQRKKFIDQVQKEEGYKEGKSTVFKNEDDFKQHGF